MTAARRSLEQLLADAGARITRLAPRDAAAAVRDGALLVDIRSELARERNGVVPGSLHIPRTVLEWRLDPDGAWRNPHVDAAARVVLLCDHGFASVLAAATLVELGFTDAGDVIGGFEAWRAAGLPIVPAPPPHVADELPGMRPPDPSAPE